MRIRNGSLRLDAIGEMRAGKAAAAAYEDYKRHCAEQLALQPGLTDFRLFWTALGRALGGRDKIIIDADKVPGRRNLLLMDPDQFKVPVPMLAPRPLREGPGEGP